MFYLNYIVTEKFAEKLRNMYCKLFFKQTIVLELAAGKDAPNTCQKPCQKMWRLAQENTKHCPNIFLELPPRTIAEKVPYWKPYIYIHIFL